MRSPRNGPVYTDLMRRTRGAEEKGLPRKQQERMYTVRVYTAQKVLGHSLWCELHGNYQI